MEFFPSGVLGDHPDLHAFRDRWYVSHLLSMEEQPLAFHQANVYRLLFLPTFDPPAVVRLTVADGAWQAVFKRSDGQGGFEPGRLASVTTRTLSRRQATQFELLLERTAFWEMPSVEDSDGLDGSQAILEGVRAGRYQVVDRWSPDGTDYAKLVEFLLRQSGYPRKWMD